MVKVVATVFSTIFLPREGGCTGLVLDHDALFEGGVVVFAAIAAIHRDLHGVELVLGVLLGLENVIGLANVVVEKRHLFKLFTRFLIYNYIYFILFTLNL